MAINKALLRKVAKYILAEPRRYDQRTFGTSVRKSVSPCGTQACIAGWAAFLANGTNPASFRDEGINIQSEAQEALGLTDAETDTLFIAWPEDDIGGWPEPYCTEYRKAKNKQAKAEVAARYLRRIARTGKVT